MKLNDVCTNLTPDCGYGEPRTSCGYCDGVCCRPSLEAMPKEAAYDPEDGPYYESLESEDFVRMQALCYAFGQALDCISVVYKDADEDKEIHAMQVKSLACIIAEYYDHFSPAQQRTIEKDCYWFTKSALIFAEDKCIVYKGDLMDNTTGEILFIG